MFELHTVYPDKKTIFYPLTLRSGMKHIIPSQEKKQFSGAITPLRRCRSYNIRAIYGSWGHGDLSALIPSGIFVARAPPLVHLLRVVLLLALSNARAIVVAAARIFIMVSHVSVVSRTPHGAKGHR